MEYRRFADTYVIRLDRGEEIVKSLTKLCADENVQLGCITGLGAADRVILGLFDVAKGKFSSAVFEGAYEIASLTGNATRKDGEVSLHLHAAIADSTQNALGGHLSEARISATAEIFMTVAEGRVERKSDGSGLNLMKF